MAKRLVIIGSRWGLLIMILAMLLYQSRSLLRLRLTREMWSWRTSFLVWTRSYKQSKWLPNGTIKSTQKSTACSRSTRVCRKVLSKRGKKKWLRSWIRMLGSSSYWHQMWRELEPLTVIKARSSSNSVYPITNTTSKSTKMKSNTISTATCFRKFLPCP